jgi:selenocysteine lyase/cysteine desulfurase
MQFDKWTVADLSVMLDSLNYSVQRVSDYPHREYEDKRMSLRPIEDVREKVRRLLAARKEEKRGR